MSPEIIDAELNALYAQHVEKLTVSGKHYWEEEELCGDTRACLRPLPDYVTQYGKEHVLNRVMEALGQL